MHVEVQQELLLSRAICNHHGFICMQAALEPSGDAAAASALMSLQKSVSPAAASQPLTDLWASPPAQGTGTQVCQHVVIQISMRHASHASRVIVAVQNGMASTICVLVGLLKLMYIDMLAMLHAWCLQCRKAWQTMFSCL